MVIRELPTAPVLVSSASFLLARCNGRRGYWDALRRLLAAQSYVLAAADLAVAVRRAAEVIGLPEPAVAPCLADDTAITDLNKRRQASLDDGIDSTPTFIFNGRRLLPGDRLAGGVYEGGELSAKQFDAAVRRAQEQAPVSDHQRPTKSN